MSGLRMKLGLSRESLDEEGTPDEIAARKRKRVLDARIAAARANPNWKEVEESALSRRPFGYRVHAETGQTFRIYRGEVFAYGAATIAFVSDRSMMWFYVSDDDLVFLEYVGQWETIYGKRVS